MGEIAQVVSACAAIGALLISAYNAWRIEQVHIATNSMKDALVATTAKESFAAGRESERIKQKEI